ncbi:hypothetical protein [Microvirga tunisiensis]|uniref:Uncharacterized protein n=1 Tax=Microvirga tunisiensis TaxID=2108360 RepID=A0A5N7MAE8_9HYPH|nr:hypothetical protein [Microvirga tunisiensis]MPR05682.1 hypothetical protein [Microvirga tunisiensis]MPR23882.1 hypothetical protein [Microvirga tunisiensis]
MSTPNFVLTDAITAETGYRIWLDAMIEDADSETKRPTLYSLSAERLLLETSSEYQSGGPLPEETWVAFDGDGASWTVQLNLPKGNVGNVLTGVARDQNDNLWLLRQGWLKKNSESADKSTKSGHIRGDAFRVPSGLARVNVSGGLKNREWYPVARLNVPPETIREQTSEFVARCSEVRARYALAPLDPNDTAVIQELLGPDESSEPYVIGPKDAQPEKLVRNLQGEVWKALKAKLKEAGKELKKQRHAAGYEVDGAMAGPPEALLIEIKSSIKASDVFGGIGQLMLYRRLIPSVRKHRAILLVPRLPKPVLIKAAKDVGVTIETYKREGVDGKDVSFSPSFLALCGF